MNKPLNIILSGGGTGGHIYPAIAIAKAIQQLNPNTNILFIGANNKMEMEKVPSAGFPIKGIDIIGLQRKITIKNLLLPYYLFKSIYQSLQIIHSFQPHAVIGTGGYVSFPVLAAAQLKNIPTYIQEQNAYAGLTNKLLSKKTKKIFVAFNNMHLFFPKNKILFTGNPVRNDLLNIHQKKEIALKHFSLSSQYPTILVLGGSLGAKNINQTIANNLNFFLQNKIQLIWQMGKTFYNTLPSSLSKQLSHPLFYYKDFIYEMNLAYAAADLIVSRAGATTIAELTIVAKPSILIPSPNVTANHQTKNALALSQQNAAILIEDQNIHHQLINQIDTLIKHPELQQKLSQNISKFAKPNAASDIASTILKDLSYQS